MLVSNTTHDQYLNQDNIIIGRLIRAVIIAESLVPLHVVVGTGDCSAVYSVVAATGNRVVLDSVYDRLVINRFWKEEEDKYVCKRKPSPGDQRPLTK